MEAIFSLHAADIAGQVCVFCMEEKAVDFGHLLRVARLTQMAWLGKREREEEAFLFAFLCLCGACIIRIVVLGGFQRWWWRRR